MGKVNILLVGATGSGKSSTINALLGDNVAKVGDSPDPETMTITRYEYGNRVLWDTPGLGDGILDASHSQQIIEKLLELDQNGYYLIDQVITVIDGSTRDLGTVYKLLETIIIPNLGKNTNRLLVAINQADRAMKGRHWNDTKNKPEDALLQFLERKVESVRNRIKSSTGVDVKVIYYSSKSKQH